jgi:signal transduction histidine kinase
VGEIVETRGRWSGLGGLRSALSRRLGGLDSKRDLIAALNDVADAVSSAMDLDDVLAVIVERAKEATDTDKAILVLADPDDERLDLGTLVVRGARAEHPQEWWERRLVDLGPRVFETRDVVIDACPEQSALMLRLPVRVRDHPIGVICAINSQDRVFTNGQIDFLVILSAFAAAAIENARLAEQDRYLLLSSERNRIAREMHDGVVQSLFSVSLGIEVCKKLVQRDPVQVVARLEDLQSHLNSSMGELRRLVYDLRSMRLKQLGLQRAIEYWIREVSSSDGGPRGQLTVEGALPAMSQQLESCLYRVAKESVSNVIKHAEAQRFAVRLSGGEDCVALVVEDDGCGFDVEAAMSADRPSGVGLRSIKERVGREGGLLAINSALNHGTVISVEFSGLGEA